MVTFQGSAVMSVSPHKPRLLSPTPNRSGKVRASGSLGPAGEMFTIVCRRVREQGTVPQVQPLKRGCVRVLALLWRVGEQSCGGEAKASLSGAAVQPTDVILLRSANAPPSQRLPPGAAATTAASFLMTDTTSLSGCYQSHSWYQQPQGRGPQTVRCSRNCGRPGLGRDWSCFHELFPSVIG